MAARRKRPAPTSDDGFPPYLVVHAYDDCRGIVGEAGEPVAMEQVPYDENGDVVYVREDVAVERQADAVAVMHVAATNGSDALWHSQLRALTKERDALRRTWDRTARRELNIVTALSRLARGDVLDPVAFAKAELAEWQADKEAQFEEERTLAQEGART
jgi:hypothetical protein